jgi:hypothetical protein
VQWAAGQRSGTGYDPQPWDGTIRNAGYVRRILTDYWPAKDAPAVPGPSTKVINNQRSGTVAMAIHYFTDGVVLPPNYRPNSAPLGDRNVGHSRRSRPMIEHATATRTVAVKAVCAL